MAKKYYGNGTAKNTVGSAPKREKKAYYLENDGNAIANMPQEVRMAKYPACSYTEQHYGDSMEDIDAKQYDSVRKVEKNYMRRKGG